MESRILQCRIGFGEIAALVDNGPRGCVGQSQGIEDILADALVGGFARKILDDCTGDTISPIIIYLRLAERSNRI